MRIPKEEIQKSNKQYGNEPLVALFIGAIVWLLAISGVVYGIYRILHFIF